ncbi:MAG: hypothetical protein JRG81_00135 [Deltaproteobacteria bacterium]|nr:hypothetical protein [Deltaproteobacteria bacterium]MBW2363485.1 hypothetical protein [Deltaproteobacteria bacterium]
MKILYVGKKAPITFKMGYLSKHYLFKNNKDPIHVKTGDAKKMLAENPNMLKVLGDQGGFVFVEEEKEVPDLKPIDNDKKSDPDLGPDAITRETLDELTKAEIGEMVLEKFGIELNVTKNKEAVISDTLVIAAAA